MYAKLTLLVAFMLSTSAALYAQWQWLDFSISSANFERVEDLAVDETRNVVYSVGFVTATPSFPEIANTQLSGGDDGFVMKYDLDGNVIWAFAVGGTSNDRINSVAVDEQSGNIYVTGYLRGSFASNGTELAGISGGASGNVTTASGNDDAFVACYNTLGQLIWHRIIGGAGLDRGIDIDVNSSGVFLTGIYTNVSLIGTLLPVFPFDNTINNFVMALNLANGTTLWDAVLASTADDYVLPASNDEIRRTGISADANGVYLVTYFNGSTYRVYNGSDVLAASIVDPNASDEDFVVTSYTNTGAHNWSVLYNNAGTTCWGLDITNDCSGVYVSGTLNNGGISPGGTVVSSLHDDFILSKLNKATGDEIWLKEFNSSVDDDDHFIGLDADGYGNLYAVGRLAGTQVSMGTELNYSGGASDDKIMIAHFHTDGAFQSFEAIPPTDDSWAMSVAAYKNEKYVVGGYYNDWLYLESLTAINNADNGFVATRKLPPAIDYVSTSGSQVLGNVAFCQSEMSVTPNLNVPVGGIFSAPQQVVFTNTATGEINLAASTPGGPYVISYSASALTCLSALYTTSIYIWADQDASFTYPNTVFCNAQPNPSAASIATPGGTFSGPQQLVFANTSTGEIDVAASTIGGPYYLVYTTSGTNCPSRDSIQVYITAPPNPTFGYGSSNYCAGTGSIIPTTLLTAGGLFSAPSGIVLANPTTGEIDLNASTPGGPYIIQYTVTSGGCVQTSIDTLTIIPPDNASFTYADNHLCVNEPNVLPTSIATPGGVFSAPAELALTNASTGEINAGLSTVGGPYQLVYTSAGNCPSTDTLELFIETPPDASFTYEQSDFCSGTGTVTPNSISTIGGTFSAPAEIVFLNASTGEIDLNASTVGGPYTITYTVSNAFCQDSSTFSLSILQTQNALFSYSGSTFCKNDINPIATSIWTVGGTFSGPPEVVFVNTGSGEIDIVASTAGGPYNLVYTTAGPQCPSSYSLPVYIVEAPNPSIAYPQSSYCQGAGTIVLPSSITPSGGIFSAPVGIVINSTTGAIDIDASFVGGPNTIQYLVSNSFCQEAGDFDIYITPQDNVTSVDYSSNEFCVSDANQTPVINGTTGGVFSAPNAITLVNATTGEFSPSSSTPGGPYLIRYVTQGSCPDSLEVPIALYEVPIADAGDDQEKFFVFSSNLNATPVLTGVGKWTTPSSALIDDEFDPLSPVSNLKIGENTFIWTVTNGACPAVSDQMLIDVEDLYIPQAVTPNADGKNDFFELRSLDEVTCSLQIFNRWGQIIYENSDYQNEWYGQNMNGDELENDTYFYVILIDDALSYNGYIVLKK